MTTTSPDLTKRTPEAEMFYNIKDGDYANFHVGRPVCVGRECTGQSGVTLDYSPTGGRNWQIMSFHETIPQAIDAFHSLPAWKDRDPLHYRILQESR